MNVTLSDKLTSDINYLRNNVYQNQKFVDTFSGKLKSKVNAEEVKFVPDSLGGWIVEANIGKNENGHKSENYVNPVVTALDESIKMCCDKKINNLPGICNVIVSGESSISIRI